MTLGLTLLPAFCAAIGGAASLVIWQNGFVTITGGPVNGLQSGGYNRSGGGQGVQFGVVNMTTGEFSGLMLGFFNIAEQMSGGLQIGLINIIQNKEKLKVFPLVNWKF